MAALSVNGTTHQVDADPNTPLLWVLRETDRADRHQIRLRHRPVRRLHRSTSTASRCARARCRLSAADGRQITTIEGLAQSGALHKVQKAWLEHDVPQCGYCQSGMIMAVAALLKDKPKPTDADIDADITNICRCGTFQQVRAAIHAAAASA